MSKIRTNILSILPVLFFSLIILIYGCDGGGGSGSNATGENPGNPSFRSSNPLTADDVRLIIQQAVTEAVNIGVPVTVSVVDRGGNTLGVFQMADAPISTVIGSQDPDNIIPVLPEDSGLELIGLNMPEIIPPELRFPPDFPLAALASISKAGTAAFLSTSGNAFTTLTVSDIIQEHRPVGISFVPSGPLFGTQLL